MRMLAIRLGTLNDRAVREAYECHGPAAAVMVRFMHERARQIRGQMPAMSSLSRRQRKIYQDMCRYAALRLYRRIGVHEKTAREILRLMTLGA